MTNLDIYLPRLDQNIYFSVTKLDLSKFNIKLRLSYLLIMNTNLLGRM